MRLRWKRVPKWRRRSLRVVPAGSTCCLLFICLLAWPADSRRAQTPRCTLRPAHPTAGRMVTVIYDSAGGPLARASSVRVHRSFDNWTMVASPDQVMSRTPGTARYQFTYRVPEAAYSLDYAFTDGGRTWDNNQSADWHFPVHPGTIPRPLPNPPRLPANASSAHVMMQGFYWDVPTGGTWYDTMAGKAAALRNMQGGQGIDRIWFPPPSKGAYGVNSMGYDPYDYYDLGTYNQRGGVRTRFGTQAQLRRAIAAFRRVGIVCMADIILNHRDGGAPERDPNLGGATTRTDFRGVLSKRCTWTYNQFHPSTYELSDEGAFGGFADVCSVTGNAPGCPRHDLIAWGRWLQDARNAGFDGGWRFDFVKGYRPSFCREFRAGTGNAFGILECWDGNVPTVNSYVRQTGGASAFDFPGYYTLRNICNDTKGAHNIADLLNGDRVYASRNPERAVTFCANHDTDEIASNKMLAYAFILTYRGYPCIFWKDYFDRGLATLGGQSGNGINRLVWARGALAGGRPSIETLKRDDRDLLVYGTRSGTLERPGYIVAINDDPIAPRSAALTTGSPSLRGKRLVCCAWYSYVDGRNVRPPGVTCSRAGAVRVTAPPRGYAVYTVADRVL